MTIAQALSRSAAVKPSQYTDADKVQWLAVLDGIIWEEIISTHEGAPETEYVPYDPENYDPDTVLLAAFPWDQLYITYICSMIDLYNGETIRYNNDNLRYVTEYDAYAAWYNRKNMPLQNNSITLGGGVVTSGSNPLNL